MSGYHGWPGSRSSLAAPSRPVIPAWGIAAKRFHTKSPSRPASAHETLGNRDPWTLPVFVADLVVKHPQDVLVGGVEPVASTTDGRCSSYRYKRARQCGPWPR